MKKRGIILVFILITFLFVVSGCSSGSNDVSKAYDQALRDLKNGRYTEAADTLATISFYEDSLQLSQYCRAQALAEEEKYSDALAVLQNLGDYRDSVQCCEYFRARMMETISTDAISQAQAALFYDNVEYGFRDAAIRAETIRSTLYLKGTEAEENGEWDYSSYVFSALENYKDSQTRRHYVTGRGLEAKGSDETIQYAEAIKEYEYSISYEDSKDRIQSCIDAVYREAERDITSQEFEKAETLYLALGDHCDKEKFTSLKAAKESFAEKLIEAGEFDKAKDIYLSLGEKEKATGTIYKKAMYLEQNGEIRLAATLFLSINDYLDSREKHYALGTEQITNDLVMASAILLEDKKYKDSEDQLYQIADEASAKGQYTLSISVFNELGNTRDCRLRMTNDLYLYGMSLLANGQNDEAAAVFDKIYGFGSAVLYANMARYAAAEKLQERELFSKAAEAFEQIEDYEDAKSRAVECRYKDGLQKKNNTDYVTAIAVFDGLGNYKDSKEEKTECNYLLAVQHQNNKKWENAVRIFEELADYSDSEERCIVCWDNIGEEQLNNNRAEDAYYSFIKARNENGQERAALAIADNYLANMNLEKALTWYRKATTLKETEIRTAGIAQSLLNVEEDDLSEQFASVIPGSEKCKDIFYALAIRSMERQDEDSAMRQMQKAGDTVETSEKFRDMLNARVDALVSNGQYDEAAALCVSNGDSVQADRLLAEKIKKDEEKKKKEEAEKQKQHQSRIDEANELVKREEYEAAIKILTEIDETKLAEKVILQKNAAEEAKRKEEEEAERLRYQAREEVGKNLLEKGEYDAAYSVFKEIDNQELMSESIYQKAEKLDQPELYLTILDYKDSQEKHYLTGKALLETDPERAFRILSEDINYSDSQTLLYDLANLESGKENYKLSYVIFDFLSQQPLDTVNLRPDCHMRAVQDCYKYGLALLRQGDWESAAKIFKAQGDLSLAADHEKEAQYARAMEFEEKGSKKIVSCNIKC